MIVPVSTGKSTRTPEPIEWRTVSILASSSVPAPPPPEHEPSVAPLGDLGCYRIGEDRCQMLTKRLLTKPLHHFLGGGLPTSRFLYQPVPGGAPALRIMGLHGFAYQVWIPASALDSLFPDLPGERPGLREQHSFAAFGVVQHFAPLALARRETLRRIEPRRRIHASDQARPSVRLRQRRHGHGLLPGT